VLNRHDRCLTRRGNHFLGFRQYIFKGNGRERPISMSDGATMLIENVVMVYVVAAIAAFCFKYRDPRKAR
jgi:hypothetical protein